MTELEQWQQYLPKPGQLEVEHTHVYLSYPARDRHVQWTIQLYDALRHHGFAVRLAQYVRRQGQHRPDAHIKDLSNSGAAIQIWSAEPGDLTWFKEEYDAIDARRANDPAFRFTVLQLEQGVPNEVDDRSRLDCTGQGNGPCGTVLLNILSRITDQAARPDARQLAEKIDREAQQAMDRIRIVRTEKDQESIATAATAGSLGWSASPLLGTIAANRLIDLRAYDLALEVLNELERRFPAAIRPRQLHGLALRRNGDLDDAHLVLGRLYDAGERDPETLGIAAAAWMDRYALSRDEEHLRRSRDLYAVAFETQPANYYVGINAATKSMLLGDDTRALEHATEVEKIIGEAQDYWSIATRAELKLIRRQYDEAAKLYQDAVNADPQATGSHESTWLQAQRLLIHFQRKLPFDADRAAAAAAFQKIAEVFPRVGPALDFTQEVRLAVVMYGGVSLAIYINGVTQELLHLVRATAPMDLNGPRPTALPRKSLESTDQVYRQLGQLLGRNSTTMPDPTEPIRTRFVIDIVSGTSAGGINGIFLAKALAQNQHLGKLKEMWIEQAGIDELINDRGKVPSRKSLLDSRHLYRKLLEAFQGMTEQKAKVAAVEELDLFVTATDLQGLELSIALGDQKVFEKRHKNVFHFGHVASDPQRQDFHPDNIPFLAFAARCTSAFPFAFEPMKLTDIDEVVAETKPFNQDAGTLETFKSNGSRWRVFYPDYIEYGADRTTLDKQSFPDRNFGDGGYLDNKPFSHAIDAMLRRRADNMLVRRRLIYIEPSPEMISSEPSKPRDVNVLENVVAALLTLPRHETIREDLERVRQHNEIIEEVEKITQRIEGDMSYVDRQRVRKEDLTFTAAGAWGDQDLKAMIKSKGVTYGSYHRLKVEKLSQELSEFIAAVAGVNEKSEEFHAIPYLVRAWIDQEYVESRPSLPAGAVGGAAAPADGNAPNKPTQNRLLVDFDLGYRLRRINFIRTKADWLVRLDDEVKKVIEAAGENGPANSEERADFEYALAELKRRLNRVFQKLRAVGVQLRQAPSQASRLQNPLHEAVKDVGALRGVLREIARQKTEKLRRELADRARAEWSNEFKEIADRLRDALYEPLMEAARACEDAIHPGASSLPTGRWMKVVQECLWPYYKYYEDYDHVAFAIFYQTGIGEGAKVDVLRISPDFLTADGEPKTKLAGTAFANFGGFLDRSWRENDVLWGRLDAARRIITTSLPENHPQRDVLLRQAQTIIVKEEVQVVGDSNVRAELLRALQRANQGMLNAAQAQTLIDTLNNIPGKAPALEDESLRAHMLEKHSVKPDLDPQMVVSVLARSTQVVGKMLEGLAEHYNQDKRHVTWITRLGLWFWGLVQVAVPGSLPSLFFQHWMKLLYLFEVALIAGGMLMLNPTLQHAGLVALGLTVALNVAATILTDYMEDWRRWESGERLRAIIVCVATVLLLGIVALSAYAVWKFWFILATLAASFAVIRWIAFAIWLAALTALFVIGAWRGLYVPPHTRTTCPHCGEVVRLNELREATDWRGIAGAVIRGLVVSIVVTAILYVSLRLIGGS